MNFLKVKCIGGFNSYRQPDFHTYHKSLPLPPKTTIAGMLGGALGLSPEEVNENWLLNKRLQIGIIGKSNGQVKDLWRIRKYKGKSANFTTSPLVREIHYDNQYTLYFQCSEDNDFEIIQSALTNPKWALSLGREDELIKILSVELVDLKTVENAKLTNTVVGFDVNEFGYSIDETYLFSSVNGNLLNLRPVIIRSPISFKYDKDHSRQAAEYQIFSFIGDLPIVPKFQVETYFDELDNQSFQLI